MHDALLRNSILEGSLLNNRQVDRDFEMSISSERYKAWSPSWNISSFPHSLNTTTSSFSTITINTPIPPPSLKMASQDTLTFPSPHSSWSSTPDPNVPSMQIHGFPTSTPGRKAYLILLEAVPGHEDDVASFLRDINDGVNKEPGTGPWFGTRFSKTSFAIFEAFPDQAARDEHDKGPGGRNFLRIDELKDWLAWPAQMYRLDVMHGKFGTLFGQEVKGVDV
jgi:quinol monooxygenase YgiN